MNQFKIRASAAGKIMAGSAGLTAKQTDSLNVLMTKEKRTDKQDETMQGLIHKRDNPELSQGAKTYCKQWLKEQIYDRRKEFTSKYTDKGNIMEDNSLDFVAEQLDFGMLIKNEEHFSDDHMTGTPDAILKNAVIDVKNSWDFSTFPLFETAIPDPDYYWQAQTYMNLTGKSKYLLIYVLSDTPLHLIEKEAYYFSKDQGYGDLEQDMLDKFIKKMTYPDIDDALKLKVFEIDRNEEHISQIKERSEMCLLYIDDLKNNLK